MDQRLRLWNQFSVHTSCVVRFAQRSKHSIQLCQPRPHFRNLTIPGASRDTDEKTVSNLDGSKSHLDCCA
jgi:hypothetical protein